MLEREGRRDGGEKEREREREREREHELRERETLISCLSYGTGPGIKGTTWVCALAGDGTHDLPAPDEAPTNPATAKASPALGVSLKS